MPSLSRTAVGELVEFLDSTQFRKWTFVRREIGLRSPLLCRTTESSVPCRWVPRSWPIDGRPLILRELILGSTRFNDIARGLPGISRSLLVQRLKHLERKGVLERWPSTSGRGSEYRLTPAGKDLENVVFALGEWSVHWLYNEMEPRGIDPITLTWWMHHRVDPAAPSRPAAWSSSSTTPPRSGSPRGSCWIAGRRRCATSTLATTATWSSRARRPPCRECSTASSRGATPSPPGRYVSTALLDWSGHCHGGSSVARSPPSSPTEQPDGSSRRRT